MKTLQQALVNSGWATKNQEQQPTKKKTRPQSQEDLEKKWRSMGVKHKKYIDQESIERRVEYKKAAKESKKVYNRIMNRFPELQPHIGKWSEDIVMYSHWDSPSSFDLEQIPGCINLHQGLQSVMDCEVGSYEYQSHGTDIKVEKYIITHDNRKISEPGLTRISEFLAEKNLSMSDIKFFVVRNYKHSYESKSIIFEENTVDIYYNSSN